ncbi:CDP-alcohol phosphatidyltransferase family protein [Natranaeroarchaeum aerophilus]|uniref:CDP-alcohol phosphatidyltransferase family protein n=1 Tax=Natranaeroarchaeum aerophilus TaxID=2917711 RepID=A0AAE3FPA0_9EURY|nr:CDP-alcohol phosphatidyltransferase family protein [Natranaeroarchaeum aerophilus]MCL9812149.1 CDP-alcohol phosphatidyltransferase family protein [Natranaeroarchaeum aerophilus]
MTAEQPRTVTDHRHHWLVAAGVIAVLTLIGGSGIALAWESGPTHPYLLGAITGFAAVSATTWRTFQLARTEVGPERITIATWVTVARGGALALLVGFLVVPQPDGVIAWMPGVLFALAAAVDAIDGAVARWLDCESKRGERLDVEVDALTIIVGAVLAVQYGVAPVIFIAVGVARYAFVGGIRYRRYRGRDVHELDPSNLRRALGGAAMLVIWLALMPIPAPPLSRLLAWLLLVPFLLNFTRDWLVVSGRLAGSH